MCFDASLFKIINTNNKHKSLFLYISQSLKGISMLLFKSLSNINQ